MPPSFFQPGPASDLIYVSHRDHRSKLDVKRLIEGLWREYLSICPDDPAHFVNDARRHFVARSWELYVAGALRRAGHTLVRPPPKGPDICIVRKSGRIWVECVAPEQGVGADALDVRVGGDRRIYGLDDKKIILRITSVIADKASKVRGYVDAGIVGQKEAVVLAITLAAIPHADLEEVEFPLVVRAVFPIGDFYLAITPGSDAPAEPGYLHQPRVRKSRGAEVPTTGFTDTSLDVLSGVIFSSRGIWNAPRKIGSDLGFVQNPNARVSVSKRLLRFRRTYWAKNGALYTWPARPWGR